MNLKSTNNALTTNLHILQARKVHKPRHHDSNQMSQQLTSNQISLVATELKFFEFEAETPSCFEVVSL